MTIVPTTTTTTTTNPERFYCSRPGCKSLILRENTASLFVSSEDAIQMLHESRQKVLLNSSGDWFRILPPSSISSATLNSANSASASVQPDGFWLVQDIFDFDNIGFSKPLNSTAETGIVDENLTGLRYLCCADCEEGPLGIQDSSVILLCADRVRPVKNE